MDRKWLRAAYRALTGRAFVAVLTLAAALIALPALQPSTSASLRSGEVQTIAEHDALRAVYDGLPARIAQLEHEVAALPASAAAQRALEGARDQYTALTHAFAARDEETYLTAMAAYYETVSGLTGSNQAYYDARAIQLHAVAELGEPELYRLPQDMPAALYLVSDQFSAAPLALNIAQLMGDEAPSYDGSLDFLVLLIPLAWAVLRGADAAWVTVRRGGEKPSARDIAGVAAFATAIGIVACAAAVLPAAIIAYVRNGLGDLSYPAVTMRGAAYEILSVGAVLVVRAALYVALAGFVAALSTVSLAFTRNSKVARAAMALMLFAVAQPWYFAPLGPVSDFAQSLPTTYFDVARLTGVCRDVIVSSSSTSSPVGAGALGGIIVLSAFAGALLGAAALGVRLASPAASDSPATPAAVWSPWHMMRSPVMWAVLVLTQVSAVWPLLAPRVDSEASVASMAQLGVVGYTLALLRFTPLVVLIAPSIACALGFAWRICRGAPPGASRLTPAPRPGCPSTTHPVLSYLPRIALVVWMSLRSAAWGTVFLCVAAMPAQLVALQLQGAAVVSHGPSLLVACGLALFLINFIASLTVIAAAAITHSFARACATAVVVCACVAFADSEARTGGRAAALHQMCRLGLLVVFPLLVDLMRSAPTHTAFACTQGVRALSGVLPYAQRCWYTAFMARAGRVRGSGMGADGQGDEDDDPHTAMGGRMASCRNRDSNDHQKQAADRLASSDGRFFMLRARGGWGADVRLSEP